MLTANRSFSKWNTYGVQLSDDMKDKINEFIGSDAHGNFKPFRISKNRAPINALQHFPNAVIPRMRDRVNQPNIPQQQPIGNLNQGNQGNQMGNQPMIQPIGQQNPQSGMNVNLNNAINFDDADEEI